jgi:GNAT superfamily N-acetyltransferase
MNAIDVLKYGHETVLSPTTGDNPMTDILTDLSPWSLAGAIKANLYAFFQSLRYSSKATVHDNSQGFRWHTAVAHPWFNGVLSTQPPGEDAAQMVGDTLAYFRSRGVASFTWWLAPQLEPSAWTQQLLAHGFQYDDHTPGMAIDLAALPLPIQHPLTIRPVEDRHTFAQWACTFIQGYGIPEAMTPIFLALIESLGTNLPFRHYLGFLDDRQVAASTLFLGAGVAGIYNVTTLAEVRGQGIGSAMTLAPLYEARDLGYRVGVLQSSEMGYRVYQRLGFQKFCQMDHFYRQIQNHS